MLHNICIYCVFTKYVHQPKGLLEHDINQDTKMNEVVIYPPCFPPIFHSWNNVTVHLKPTGVPESVAYCKCACCEMCFETVWFHGSSRGIISKQP